MAKRGEFWKGRKHKPETIKKLKELANDSISTFKKGHRGYWFGKKMPMRTEYHKKKISKANQGRKWSVESRAERCGQKNPMFGSKLWVGRKHSEETKAKISKNKIGIYKGEKHWNWQGGITPINSAIRQSTEYKLWRKTVFERDNYTCIWCGDDKGGNLEADHIKPFSLFPELRFAIDNGRTLCVPCHKTTETYGRKTKFKK